MTVSFLKRHIGALVALIPACGILLGMLVPIYVDEIAWRFLERSTIDGGIDRAMSESCGPTVMAAPPVFMVPMRYIGNAIALAFSDPFYVRLIGVAGSLAWLVLLWVLITRIGRDLRERRALHLLAFAMVSTGVLPLMLVLSRPEEPMILTLTIALLATLWGWGRKQAPSRPAQAWTAAVIVVLMAAIALSFHPKGVIYAPVFVLCALLSSSGSKGRWLRPLAAGIIIVLTVIAIPYWSSRFKCPDDPILVAKLAHQNLALFNFRNGSILETLRAALAGANPMQYVRLTEPAPFYMSDWLPTDVVSRSIADPWRRIIYFCWTIAFSLGLFSLVITAVRIVKEKVFDPRALMPVALGMTVLGWGALQIVKNDYEASLVVPVCAIAIVFAVRSACYDDGTLRWIERIGAMFATLAFVSVALVMIYYTQPLWEASRQSGYLRKQRLSISPYGFDKLRPHILATGRMCGLTPDTRTHGLLVDDVTYFAYMGTYRPLHWTGVLSIWNGSIADPAAFLSSKNSSGIILGCDFLKPELRSRARRNGQFCCLGAEDLKPK
ncbi:MAG: hypothetical protein JWO15_3413 [Sphingomonadales bacterium]|nr:hypothetical protein [Sphingomonadales bacterium]